MKHAQRSYAQVVKNEASANKSWKGIKFITKELEMYWMKHSFVGRLHNFDHLDSLNDNLILGGMNFLKARYLGDNMVLITSLDGT